MKSSSNSTLTLLLSSWMQNWHLTTKKPGTRTKLKLWSSHCEELTKLLITRRIWPHTRYWDKVWWSVVFCTQSACLLLCFRLNSSELSQCWLSSWFFTHNCWFLTYSDGLQDFCFSNISAFPAGTTTLSILPSITCSAVWPRRCKTFSSRNW